MVDRTVEVSRWQCHGDAVVQPPAMAKTGKRPNQPCLHVGPPWELLEPVARVREQPPSRKHVLHHVGGRQQRGEGVGEIAARHFVAIDREQPVSAALGVDPRTGVVRMGVELVPHQSIGDTEVQDRARPGRLVSPPRRSPRRRSRESTRGRWQPGPVALRRGSTPIATTLAQSSSKLSHRPGVSPLRSRCVGKFRPMGSPHGHVDALSYRSSPSALLTSAAGCGGSGDLNLPPSETSGPEQTLSDESAPDFRGPGVGTTGNGTAGVASAARWRP